MSSTKKEQLREKFLKIRYKITNKDLKDMLLAERFINSDIFKNSKSILIYINTEYEVGTKSIVEKAWEKGKTVYAPFINDVDIGKVESWKDFDKLKQNDEIYLVPKEVELDYSFDLCIIPGVVFDTKGFRIGFGSGWYDQFLEGEEKVLKVGFAFDEQVVASIPQEEHDISLDILFTPTKQMKFSN